MPLTDGAFQLPEFLDYLATASWAFTGGLLAARRGFDVVGVLALALVSATGGGLLRDGLFLQSGPPTLVQVPTYLLIILGAALAVMAVGRFTHHVKWLDPLVFLLDAFGLGAYSVVGMQLAAEKGLSLPGIILVRLVNAVGGSILRDLLIRREPRVFQPGELLVTASMIGCGAFQLLLIVGLGATPAAWATIVIVMLIRILAIRLKITTRSIVGFSDPDSIPTAPPDAADPARAADRASDRESKGVD